MATITSLNRAAAIAGVFVALTLWAAEPKPAPKNDVQPRLLTLQDALALARAQHIDSILSRERVQQAIERLSQSAAPLLPQVSGASSQSRETRNLETFGITLPNEGPIVGPFNVFDARVSVTQTLFDFSVIQRLRAAAAGKDLSEAERRKAEQDVLALVADLYIEASRAADSVGYARSFVVRDRKRNSIETRMLEIGTGSDLEVKQAQAALLESRRVYESAKAAAVERRLDLTAALGIPAGQPIVFVQDRMFADPAIPTSFEIAATSETHPDIQAARETLRVREAERWAELAEFLPKISGFGDYGLSGSGPSSSETTYTLGLKGTISLFEGGATMSRAEEAESRIRESQASIRDVERRVEANILGSIQTLKSALAAVGAREAQWIAAAKESSLARERSQSGIGSALEVLEGSAQESLARDQREEAVAVYRLAQVKLLHSLGKVDQLCRKP